MSCVNQLSVVDEYFLNDTFNPPVVFGCHHILPLVFVVGSVALMATSTPSNPVVVESVAIFTHEPFETFLKYVAPTFLSETTTA